MTVRPAVSIIITNYNYSTYLATCIESCLGQRGWIPFEVILVDDGSTDASREVAAAFVGGNLRMIERENGGIEAASNTGIRAAEGDLLVRVDADDYLFPTFVETMVGAMEGTDAAFAYSDYVVVDGSGKQMYTERLPEFDTEEIESRGDFLATGTLIRKSAVTGIGGYSEKTRNCGLENYELILALIAARSIGIHVSEPLFAYRRHEHNISVTRRRHIIEYGRALFARTGLGDYRTNAYHPYKLAVTDE